MKRWYAPSEVWLNPDRLLCKLKQDGTVDFADDITTEELRTAITLLLREREEQRQARIINTTKD